MMDNLSIFATAAVAVVIEAAPFLLLGSFIGAAIEVFVPDATLRRFTPRTPLGQIATGLFAGMLLPTCECGVVPVARRLLLKGAPPRTVIPYMMAAPVVNPVVIASTLFAFQGDVSIVLLRILMVIVPAGALGFTLGGADARMILRVKPIDLKLYAEAEDHLFGDHVHGAACGCGCSHASSGAPWKDFLRCASSEFFFMSRFLILGAVVSSAFKAFLSSNVLGLFTGNIFLAIAAMMALAVLLSVCSEADAFVAASFASFPASAKLAFMALGPMVDLKLIPMFLSVFHRRLAVALIVVPCFTVYVMALAASWGGW